MNRMRALACAELPGVGRGAGEGGRPAPVLAVTVTRTDIKVRLLGTHQITSGICPSALLARAIVGVAGCGLVPRSGFSPPGPPPSPPR